LFLPTGLAKLFKSIDADSSGTITVEELKKALQDWGHRIHDVSGRLCGCAVHPVSHFGSPAGVGTDC
jgi:hypothetical protein